MTPRQKQVIPWVSVLGLLGGGIAILAAIGWGPWNHVTRAEAKEQHRAIEKRGEAHQNRLEKKVDQLDDKLWILLERTK